MITIDKEASMEAIKAFKEIFQTFGSTRLLGLVMLILGVVLVLRSTTSPSPDLLMLGLQIIAAGFALLVVSYIIRPHDAVKKQPKHPGAPDADLSNKGVGQ